MSESPSRTATYVAAFMVMVALAVAGFTGFASGSILGAVIAGVAIVPSATGMWKGMQEKTQGGLGLAILVFFAALGTAGLLLALKIIDWIS